MGKVTAPLKEITGALTGDRRTEARGRAEELAAERGEAVTGESVAAQLQEVREQHGDIPLDEASPSASHGEREEQPE